MKYYLLYYYSGVSIWERRGDYLKILKIISEPGGKDTILGYFDIPAIELNSYRQRGNIIAESDDLDEIMEHAAKDIKTKYYLLKYYAGLSIWVECGEYLRMMKVVLEPHKPVTLGYYNISVNDFVFYRNNGYVLFESENLDEIIERASLEAL